VTATRYLLTGCCLAGALSVLTLAPRKARAADPRGPQVDFPGQYAPNPAERRFPVWPSGCDRFELADKLACLASVASDFGDLARYAAANAALPAPGPGESRAVFFGDSITDGWSHPDISGGFFPGKPYVNRGISGQTTAQMLLRFRADAVDLKPRVVVILAGTNDIAGNAGPVSIDSIEGNLASMADLARVHGIQVVLASILPVSDDKVDSAGQPIVQTRARPPETINAINRWLADYARATGCVYLDYFSAFADGRGLLRPDLTGDGLHPNAAGYAVMAPLAEKAIAEALAAKR